MTWLREVAITFILSQRNKKKISIQWFYTPRCDRKNEKKKLIGNVHQAVVIQSGRTKRKLKKTQLQSSYL